MGFEDAGCDKAEVDSNNERPASQAGLTRVDGRMAARVKAAGWDLLTRSKLVRKANRLVGAVFRKEKGILEASSNSRPQLQGRNVGFAETFVRASVAGYMD